MISALAELRRLHRLLGSMEPRQGVSAHKDPTMLFSALMWGAHHEGLSKAFWPLKTALFQCGDRLIEAITHIHGLEALQKHYLAESEQGVFYTFSAELVYGTGHEDDYQSLLAGYKDCETELALYPSTGPAILRKWIEATHLAIDSVFYEGLWSQALDELNVSGLQEIVRAEEEAKNVKVVLKILSVSELFDNPTPFRGSEEEIVRACSHWFTLLDDFLDLETDFNERRPNHLVALMAETNELNPILSSGNIKFDGGLFPKAHNLWRDHYFQAREHFISTFPVFPKLFVSKLEQKARYEGISPF